MTAKLAFCSSLSRVSVLPPKSWLHNPLISSLSSPLKPRVHYNFKIQANVGGNDGEKPKGKRKFVTREEEPDQFWQTAGEREGRIP